MRRTFEQPALRRYRGAVTSVIGLALWLAMLSGANAAVLELHRGVNVHGWLNWSPVEQDGSYKWPPYRSENAWLSGDRDLSDWPEGDVFERIRGMGFDYVRLTVDPGPLLASSGEKRREALRVISDAVGRVVGAGLNVVVNLHAVSQVPEYSIAALEKGPASDEVAAYLDMVAAVAETMVAIGADQVALEPYNEPAFYPCEGQGNGDWQKIMATTVERIRSVSRELTIVATGACGGNITGLVDLDPSFDDDAVLYSFHMYEPHAFTHQGLASDEAFLSGLPWPADLGNAEGVTRELRVQMERAGLDAAEIEARLVESRPQIESYFSDNWGEPQLEARFDEAQHWAEVHSIPARRLFMGEFGAALMFESHSAGALEADRSRYLEAVRLQAEDRGIAWSVWEFSNPFGMSVIRRDGPAVADAGLLAALGLRAR